MLKEKIQENLKIALKAGRELEALVLRMVLAAVSNKEKEKRTKIWKANPGIEEKELIEESFLNEEEITQVIASEIKKRKDAALAFEKGKREDLAEKEKKEEEILKKYLPE